MTMTINIIMTALILSNLAMLGMSRLNACIRMMALQGILLGGFTLIAPHHSSFQQVAPLALISMCMKGWVFPRLLRRSIKQAGVQRELEPFVGYTLSILVGMVMFGISLMLGKRLPLAESAGMPLIASTALMTVFTGLFLMTTRRKALSQCLGYIVLENGVYAFGLAIVGEVPTLIELGILLDAFAAVLVMGIALYHINREFDHLDAARLHALKG